MGNNSIDFPRTKPNSGPWNSSKSSLGHSLDENGLQQQKSDGLLVSMQDRRAAVVQRISRGYTGCQPRVLFPHRFKWNFACPCFHKKDVKDVHLGCPDKSTKLSVVERIQIGICGNPASPRSAPLCPAPPRAASPRSAPPRAAPFCSMDIRALDSTSGSTSRQLPPQRVRTGHPDIRRRHPPQCVHEQRLLHIARNHFQVLEMENEMSRPKRTAPP